MNNNNSVICKKQRHDNVGKDDDLTRSILGCQTELDYELYLAVAGGDLKAVKRLAKEKFRWTSREWTKPWYDKPMHWAAEYGQIPIMWFLLKNGIGGPLYAKGRRQQTPLYRAAKNGQLLVVHWIIAKNRGHMGPLAIHHLNDRPEWCRTQPFVPEEAPYREIREASWPTTPFEIADKDCLKALLRCPDCDCYTKADHFRFTTGYEWDFRGWDLGNAACHLISMAIPKKLVLPCWIKIDIRDNPRIGERGVLFLETGLSQRCGLVILLCSHIPPRWIRRLKPLCALICEFPSLCTIAAWNIVDALPAGSSGPD